MLPKRRAALQPGIGGAALPGARQLLRSFVGFENGSIGESANLSASRQPPAPSGRARWGRARWSVDAQRALLAINPPLHPDRPVSPFQGWRLRPFPNPGRRERGYRRCALPWAGLWLPLRGEIRTRTYAAAAKRSTAFLLVPINQGQRLRPFRVGPLALPYTPRASASSLSCERASSRASWAITRQSGCSWRPAAACSISATTPR